MIYAVDRELIYPTYLDALVPSWLNHVMVCMIDNIQASLCIITINHGRYSMDSLRR